MGAVGKESVQAHCSQGYVAGRGLMRWMTSSTRCRDVSPSVVSVAFVPEGFEVHVAVEHERERAIYKTNGLYAVHHVHGFCGCHG